MGTPPVQFVIDLPPPPQPTQRAPVPTVLPWITAKARQPDPVKNDPRYMVDTGTGIGCPGCGSFNLVMLQKSGTGLAFFGSIGWVLALGLLDAAYANLKAQPFRCNYCDTTFTL